VGDRLRLFRAVSSHLSARRVLYPGSYADVAASFAFPSLTYVDSDKRAAAFFADGDGVLELIGLHPGSPAPPIRSFRCHSGEYLVSTENLETYLSPKKQTMLTRTMPHQSGRGIAYTRSAFAYLFERVE
jgi:hypothetical protein